MQVFIRQFTSLIRSQVPMVRSLRVLQEQMEHKGLKNIVGEIVKNIQDQGQNLSDSLKHYPKVFSQEMISLVQAGEVGGALDQVLESLDKKMVREEAMRSKIQSALVYPLFVALMGVITVIVLLTFVMPRILKVIQGFGGDLPIPTKILIGLTGMMTKGWFWIVLVCLGLGAAFAWRNFKATQSLWLDEFALKVPLVGKLIHHVEIVRFSRSLSLLLSHGVLMLPAIETAVLTVNNQFYKKELEKIPTKVKEGSTITEGLQGLSISSPFMRHSVSIGEEGGRVGQALSEVADFYEAEAERMTTILASFLEPVIILTIGLIIGFSGCDNT